MLLLSKTQNTKLFELITAAVAGGAALAGAAGQMYAQGKMNKKSLDYNWRMYDTQRKDALADWAMQNEYNSPAAQMERLKQAGLNPNLAYGNGVDGNSATMTRGTDGKAWSPQAPDIQGGVMNAVSMYQDVQQRQAQTNLIEQQVVNAEMQAKYLEAQTRAVELGILGKDFDLNLKRDLRTNLTDQQTQRLNLMKQQYGINETKLGYEGQRLGMDQQKLHALIKNLEFGQKMQEKNYQLNKGRFGLESQKQPYILEALAEQVLRSQAERGKISLTNDQIKATIDNLKTSGQLMKWEESLNKVGLQKGDPFILRILDNFAKTILSKSKK